MNAATRRAIADRFAWAVIVVTAVVGGTFIRWHGQSDVWQLIVSPDQPIWGPLAGVVVYGSLAIVLTSAFSEVQSRITPSLWAFVLLLLAALACLAILFHRLLHLLYPSIS